MTLARLIAGALLRLSILALVVWLALHDHAWMGMACCGLYLLTPLEPTVKPTPSSKPAAAAATTPATPKP